ncbi:Detected protein of unknown function [Hibiscus syriacus]|uniref:Uncharacterized protein n=1 Tax=Hibiscus syriacus TaxID=106335 RepID=A0A6A2YXS5_HIBSY|nr:Detected protein of unknown function [Hibiscus syriacus]
MQTEWEFVKNSYEQGYKRLCNIENSKTEKQKRIYSLQNEYDVGSAINDNEAWLLMANRVLKSCKESLNAEKGRQYMELLQKEIEQKLELSSSFSLTMSQLDQKIDDLMQRVVDLENAVFSETASVKRLKSDADELQEHVKSLEEDKEALVGDSDSTEHRIIALEGELSKVKDLLRKIIDQNNSLKAHFTEANCKINHLSVHLHAVKMDEEVDNMELSKEGKTEMDESVPGDSSALKDAEVEREGKDGDDSAEGRNDIDSESGNKIDADSEKCTEQVDEYEAENNFLSETASSTILDSESGNKTDVDWEKGTEQMDDYKAETKSLSGTASSTIDIENPELETDEEEELQNWRKLYKSGSGEREKILLDEYSSVLRNFKDVRKKLKEVDQKKRDDYYELASEIRELKNALFIKDEEIQSLRRKSSFIDENKDENLTDYEASNTMTSPESTLSDFIRISPVAADEGKGESIEKETKEPTLKGSLTRSRSFSTPEDTEISNFSAGPGKVDILPCATRRRGIKDEQCNRHEGEPELNGYQAAKFQGEILGMKQENFRVSDELKRAFDCMQQLKEEIESIMANLEFEIEAASASRQHQQQSGTGSRHRIPLRSFLFGIKLHVHVRAGTISETTQLPFRTY